MNRPSLLILSFLLVALGQPAFIGVFGLIAACCGLALFWRALLEISSWKKRLVIATLWFTLVQYVQFSWVLSHPYYYIYPVLVIYGLLIGTQFGLTSLFVNKLNLKHYWFGPVLAAIWTLMEWGRLFLFTGFSWNPIGLLLTGSLYPLQTASIAGVYGLTFLVILTNAIFLQAWISKRWSPAWVALAAFPYLFGLAHVQYHSDRIAAAPTLKTLLVQTHFPSEETLHFSTPQDAINHSWQEWQEIFTLLRPHVDQSVELIVLPEIVVPWGVYWPVYYHEAVNAGWREVFGAEKKLPDPAKSSAMQTNLAGIPVWMVTNAYLTQAIANLFQAETVIGFGDDEETSPNIRESYNAAFVFSPVIPWQPRYEKRLPVPMGEYIPFDWCRDLAKAYGVCGSVTPGKEAKVIKGTKASFGLSICYEETCGHLMRENRLKGAELLVNITNDGWFPHSRLPQQHFDHSRLRTVETGIPLVRACNTGVTGACDSLGQVLDSLSEASGQGTLLVHVPLYSYFTLYTLWGDQFIVGLSGLLVSVYSLFYLRFRNR